MRMGSGYFPTVLGWILVAFGAYLAVRGIWKWARRAPGRKKEALDFVAGGDPAQTPVAWSWRDTAWGLRAVTCIVASMLIFGFLMPRLGLIPALVAMFFVAAFGGREFRWREVLVLTAVMTAFAVGVFVVLLKLPFPLFLGFYLV